MADETPGSDLLAQAFRQANATFLDMVDAMSLLRALSTVPLHDITESELLHQALRVLALNQHLERCSVFLLEGDELVNAAGLDWADLVGLGVAERRHAPRRFRAGEGLVGVAAATGRLQHCRRAGEDPRFVHTNCAESGAGAVIAVTVQANGETIGVLNVSHPHPDFFGETHERALQVFASFLGQMIVNHRLLAKKTPWSRSARNSWNRHSTRRRRSSAAMRNGPCWTNSPGCVTGAISFPRRARPWSAPCVTAIPSACC